MIDGGYLSGYESREEELALRRVLVHGAREYLRGDECTDQYTDKKEQYEPEILPEVDAQACDVADKTFVYAEADAYHRSADTGKHRCDTDDYADEYLFHRLCARFHMRIDNLKCVYKGW